MLTLPPLALYIHIPWCERKCPYCDFNSHVADKAAATLPESDYIQCLQRDIKSQINYVQGRKLSSIFIGGGTPSLFSAAGISAILNNIAAVIPFSDDIEITMEANPGSAEADKFSGLFKAGVNRLSIGVQSFDDLCLQNLGRIHNSSNAIRAVKLAQAAGFTRINIDLMHGLPAQNEVMAMQDLQQAIDLGVEHISWYQLTIEQNTEFYRFPPQLPEDDLLADIQQAGFDLLAANGFYQYEISAFSKVSAQAKHNINYWQFGDYLAIGAGAHGKVTVQKGDRQTIQRYNNTRNPKDYLQRDNNFTAKVDVIDTQEALFEALMNCLRLHKGMPVKELLCFSGATQEMLMQLCQPAIDKKLLIIDESIKASPLGRQYLNTLLELLV
ncbi:MAG: radical SAM family heme chaperone HemW [Pseudomonadales bacterium]|nr:radical SAM family heme chaperone HemW [Pseudomonadales bacterium]